MGAKEDRLRQLRRTVFQRDGWQDDRGDWYAMCAIPGCQEVVSWFGTGLVKIDPEGLRTPTNMVVRCNSCGRRNRFINPRKTTQKESA